MDPDTKERLFLSLGTGLTAFLTLYCLSIWFRYWSIALEVGIALGATLVSLILGIALTSTSGSPGCLRTGRILLWLGMLGYVAALTLGILRAVGIIL